VVACRAAAVQVVAGEVARAEVVVATTDAMAGDSTAPQALAALSEENMLAIIALAAVHAVTTKILLGVARAAVASSAISFQGTRWARVAARNLGHSVSLH
jgi:hypothetical protein